MNPIKSRTETQVNVKARISWGQLDLIVHERTLFFEWKQGVLLKNYPQTHGWTHLLVAASTNEVPGRHPSVLNFLLSLDSP